MNFWDPSRMIHEEDPVVVEEGPPAVEEEGAFEDVIGAGPPVGEYHLSTRPRVVSGGQ